MPDHPIDLFSEEAINKAAHENPRATIREINRKSRAYAVARQVLEENPHLRRVPMLVDAVVAACGLKVIGDEIEERLAREGVFDSEGAVKPAVDTLRKIRLAQLQHLSALKAGPSGSRARFADDTTKPVLDIEAIRNAKASEDEN